MEPVPGSDQTLRVLRRRRAELREAMSGLEAALAAPMTSDPEFWAGRVNVALVELSADLRQHVAITEGPDGLHAQVVRSSPRLAHAVAVLAREHVTLAATVEEAITRVSDAGSAGQVDDVRTIATALLGQLVRHRQRGADVVYEAFATDIGGET